MNKGLNIFIIRALCIVLLVSTFPAAAHISYAADTVSASKSTLSVSKASVIADNADSATLTVKLQDDSSNALSGQTVTLSQGSGSSSITATQGTTDASGTATFTVQSTKAESVTYNATANGVTLTDTASITFQPGAPNVAKSTVSASKTSVKADGMDSSTVTVTLMDANSNLISGRSIALSQSGNSSITSVNGPTTNASGQVAYTVKSTKAEAITYSASIAGYPMGITATSVVTFNAGALNDTSSTVTNSNPNVFANKFDYATIIVTLKDANNNPISGQVVGLSQGSGSSTITTNQGTTNSSGMARFTVKSAKAEVVTYTATTGGTTLTSTTSVTFRAANISASTSKVTLSQSNVKADGTDSSTITVTLTDANNNPISGKNVTLSQAGGSSSITPSNGVTTNASGQAVFTVTSTKAEIVTYTATDKTDNVILNTTVSLTFNSVAVDGALSNVTVSKTTVTADHSDQATVTVTLRDSQSSLLSGKAVTLSQGSGSSTINAIQGTTDASGVATFTVSSTKAESVTYTAVVDGISLSLHPVPVTFTPGAASASVSKVTVSKANAAADGVDSSTVTVTLTDANSNPISGKTISLSQGSSQSTITPSTGVITNASGQAVFTVTNTQAGNVTYTATNVTDSIILTGTGAVTFEPGLVNAALSTVTISKMNAIADNTDRATVTVTLRDSQSNFIRGKAVTLSQGSGSSTINATQGTTDSSGVATFTVNSTKAENVTYTAIVGNVTLSLHPVTVTFIPGAASAAISGVTVSKASASANGSDSATVTVTIKDKYGNMIAGQNVKLAQGSGNSLISPAQSTTNVSGQASFTVTNTKTENVVYTANTINDNITLSQTANVNFLSNNANLASVQLSAGTLIPIFTPAQTSYLASVHNDVYHIALTPTATDSNAAIRINGNTVSSGSSSAPISLQTGNNTVTIEVLAADGQTRQTYTIQVMREPNKDARMKSLFGSSAALNPTFDPAITKYTVQVGSEVDQYSVQADVYNPLSTLTVTGATYDSSTSVYSTQLQFGNNVLNFKVTAQDGQTSTDYTIDVIRADALGELKNALAQLTIGYTGKDSAAFVTDDLSLPTTQDGMAVVWNSNKTKFLQNNGAITRPDTGDAPVMLTATIQHNGAKVSRTFLIVVKPQGLSIIGSPSTRTGIHQVPIIRNVISDGRTIDVAKVTATQLSAALQSALQNNDTNVSLIVNDTPSQPASEVIVDIPVSAYDALTNKADLRVGTSDAQVTLNKNVLSQLDTAGQSLSFRFAPVDAGSETSVVTKQALADPLVQQAAVNGTVTPIGTPMTVETNYSAYDTTLFFPASKLDLPAGSAAAQADYAAGFYVYIQHSDGEIALQQTTVKLEANGQVAGVSIDINKFSTFTLLHVKPKRASSSGGGGGSSTPTPTPTPTPIVTPGNPSTSTQPSTSSPSGTIGEHAAYINGYPDHTFRPSQTTTRAELAAMLWRVMQTNGSEAVTSSDAQYNDVPGTHWASDAIRQLHAQHIMLGVSGDRFAPNRPLTRAEFATLAVRWQKLMPAGMTAVSFTDVNGHWAASSIATLVQTGVVKGYSDSTFHPNEDVTRAELVTMMNRLLKRGPLTGVTTPTWKDVPSTHWAYSDIEQASLAHKYELQSDGTEKWMGN